jgi:inosine/xanthosine triphosphatase
MPTIKAAVGSTRPLKIRAVLDAMQSFGPQFDRGLQIEVLGFAVPSGVSHTPLSRAELMTGAEKRAEALIGLARERNQSFDFFVGLEGGLEVVHQNGKRLVFLESWALVASSSGQESWGHAGGIVLPESLAREVLDHGVELSVAIDSFAGETGIRDAQGAWGVLTQNLITRQDVLRTAVINAFAPFFNSAAYSR